jgi:hypothetical protein
MFKTCHRLSTLLLSYDKSRWNMLWSESIWEKQKISAQMPALQKNCWGSFDTGVDRMADKDSKNVLSDSNILRIVRFTVWI